MQNYPALSPDFVSNTQPFLAWVCRVFEMEAAPVLELLEEVETVDDVLGIFDIIFESRHQMLGAMDLLSCDAVSDDDTGKINGVVLSIGDGVYEFSLSCNDEGLFLSGEGFNVTEMCHPQNYLHREQLEEGLTTAGQSMLNWLLRTLKAMQLPPKSEAEGIRDCVCLEVRRFLMPDKARVARSLAAHLVASCEILDKVFDCGIMLQTAMADMLQHVGSRPLTNQDVLSVFKPLCKKSGVLTVMFEYDQKSKNIIEVTFWINLPGYEEGRVLVDEDGIFVDAPFFELDIAEGRFLYSLDALKNILTAPVNLHDDARFRHGMAEFLASIRPLLPKEARQAYYDMQRLLRSTATAVAVKIA